MNSDALKLAAAARQRRRRARRKLGVLWCGIEILPSTIDDWVACGWLLDTLPVDERRVREIAEAQANGKNAELCCGVT